MIVAFCGHRQVEDAAVWTWLEKVIAALVEEGAVEFWSGDKSEFSRRAARLAAAYRPRVRTVLVQAYLRQARDAFIYDESLYPPLENVPPRMAMRRRDQYMMENADVLVMYAVYGWGNSARLRNEALRKGKRVINYPDMP